MSHAVNEFKYIRQYTDKCMFSSYLC